MSVLTKTLESFIPYAQKRLEYDKPFQIVFESDEENAKNIFGKTAYYDPATMNVHIYSDGRHDKDMLRSISHEMIHHAQNCRGDFEGAFEMGEGYAQKSPHLRNMEAEAYLLGNGFLVRDFEDHMKMGDTILQEWKKENKMIITEVEKPAPIKKPVTGAPTSGKETAAPPMPPPPGPEVAGVEKKGTEQPEGEEEAKTSAEFTEEQAETMLSAVKTALKRMLAKSGTDIDAIRAVEAKLSVSNRVKLVTTILHLFGIDGGEQQAIMTKVKSALGDLSPMNEAKDKPEPEKKVEKPLEKPQEVKETKKHITKETITDHYKTKTQKLYQELMKKFIKKGDK